MLPEIMNHIFKYCQGSTNQIKKQHIKNIKSLNENEDLYTIDLYTILQLNMDYGYIHFHFEDFKNDY